MFVLIHGAYHGGWCWQRILERMEDAGLAAKAPDLPGHGLDTGWLSDQTMENYVARIAAIAEAADEPVTLVGHSLSGTTAILAAAQRPERIRRVIFLTAYIPAPGESVLHCLGHDPESHAVTTRTDIEGIKAVSVQRDSLGRDFYQDATPRDLGWVQDRVQLQAPAPFRHVAHYDASALASVPKAAILCTRDRAISLGHQRAMAERAGCDPILELDSDHSAFITHPDALMALLLKLSN